VGGKFHLMLIISLKPIANKYHEGKMKRTVERELKVPEIAGTEADGTSCSLQDCLVNLFFTLYGETCAACSNLLIEVLLALSIVTCFDMRKFLQSWLLSCGGVGNL